MYRAYKFRIYPNKEQQIIFAKTFGCVRFVYNRMLADAIAYYKETGKMFLTSPAKYRAELDWLKEIDSRALYYAQIHLQSAYRNFFSKKRSGFPKFKSKKTSRMRYTTSSNDGGIRIVSGKIRLPKVGFVKIVQHREITGKIKSATIEMIPTNKYYVSLLAEYESQVPEAELKNFVGLDFSMRDLYVTSGGEKANYPGFLRRSERKLARLCRWHSRRKLGGRNRERMRIKICLAYEKVSSQRMDFLHKKSHELAEKYDAVCIETLNMSAMSRTLRFGKSVSDNSFGNFREMLGYKLYLRGKKLIAIDKWFASSQICSSCGYKNPAVKDLKVREWKCPYCGAEHDRDINAAINLREEGRRIAAATVGITGSYAFGEDVRRKQKCCNAGLVELGSQRL